MKWLIAIFAALLFGLAPNGSARAGVVIDEQVTTTRGNEPAVTQTRQLLVEGHKEKMVSARNSFVIDLDKGTMMLIDPSQKAYAEMPFPPPRMPSTPREVGLNFHKTGKSNKVLDYACEEYSGATHTAMASVTTVGCFSTAAPGAAEFSEFTKAMGAKLNDAHALAGKMPSGIPLTMDSTRTVNASLSMPGLAPEQAARLKEMLSKQGPQVTKTVVTRVATRKLSADTFAAPSGYERRQLAAPHAGAAGGAPPAPGGPPAAGTKVPE